MVLSTRQKATLKHGLWVAAASVVSAALSFVAGPHLLDLFPQADTTYAIPLLTVALTSLLKWVRTEEAIDAGDGVK